MENNSNKVNHETNQLDKNIQCVSLGVLVKLLVTNDKTDDDLEQKAEEISGLAYHLLYKHFENTKREDVIWLDTQLDDWEIL